MLKQEPVKPGKSPPAKNAAGNDRRALLFAFGLVLVGIFSYGYKLWVNGIFACPADGYAPGWYLAYCNSTAYGDYDHGALWYQDIPEVTHNASQANVLFVGSSRMQYGFSTDATQRWLEQRGLSYFLLGFSHTETVRFMGPLIEKIGSRAQVLVINVDEFFEDRLTEPVATLFAGGDAPSRYDAKRRWQRIHPVVCNNIPGLCGTSPVVFRRYDNGRWQQYGANPNWKNTLTAPSASEDDTHWQQDLQLARNFLDQFKLPPGCVLLTVVPSPQTPMAKAQWLANALQTPLIAPATAGYRTRDNSHLDEPSAERWSQAFFAQAAPVIETCLAGYGKNSGSAL